MPEPWCQLFTYPALLALGVVLVGAGAFSLGGTGVAAKVAMKEQ